MAFVDELLKKAKAANKTIVLCEGEDKRVVEAASKIVKDGIAKIILIASDEDIANLMDMGVEALNDNQKDLAELAAKNGLYCFVVNNPSTGSNVIALIERPALTITTDFYISNLKEQLSSLESMKYTLSDSYEKEIGANKYSAVDATVEDVALEQHYFVRNIDKYFFSIIVTTTKDDDVTAILNCFE